MDRRRLLFPITERTFTYERYVRPLDKLVALEAVGGIQTSDFVHHSAGYSSRLDHWERSMLAKPARLADKFRSGLLGDA